MLIGLTGGIASGKSLVAGFFEACGVPVIDTDEIARQVVTPGHPAWHRLREAFGPDYFLPDGAVDRARLARLVFADPDARRRLEEITHPAIFAEVDRQVAALRRQTPQPLLIVVAVPLLYEVGAENRFDAVVSVFADPAQQRERLMRTRGSTPAEADARLAAQLPAEEKRRRATYVIDNTLTPDAARAQVRELVTRLTPHME